MDLSHRVEIIVGGLQRVLRLEMARRAHPGSPPVPGFGTVHVLLCVLQKLAGRTFLWRSVSHELQQTARPVHLADGVCAVPRLLESSLLLLRRFLRTIMSSSQLSYDSLLKQTSCSVLASVPAVAAVSVAADASADALPACST
jgi:hypothetical protein